VLSEGESLPDFHYFLSLLAHAGVAELDLKEKENPVGKLKVLLCPIEPETLLQNMQKDMEKMAPGDTNSRLNDLGEAAVNIDLSTALNEVTPLLKNIIDFGGKLAQVQFLCKHGSNVAECHFRFTHMQVQHGAF
jgi:hypothetical protein